jgi:hypothetical protein
MAEMINLRSARKRARRQQYERPAEANRLAHGQPKHLRKLEAARRAKAAGDLDRHRIEQGDGR